jgi:hypothetical protein
LDVKKCELRREMKKELLDEELHNLYSSPVIVRVLICSIYEET